MGLTEDRAFLGRAVETTVSIGLIALLALWCFQIVSPFIAPVVWSVIIAVAIYPLYLRLLGWFGGKQALSAAVLAFTMLILLLVPSFMITTSLVESATSLARDLQEGEIDIPPPPSRVSEWPLVGQKFYAGWDRASRDLEAALAQARPQLRAVGHWILSSGATAGFGIVMFALSVVIAAVLLARSESATEAVRRVADRLIDQRGDELVTLVRDTIQSVTRGILGVALIQAFLAGIGLLVASVPAAGVWALLILLMAVIQIPTLLLAVPLIIYVFATSSTGLAVSFAIWMILVGASDNVLKPILLGRGVDVPMLVIFMGAIGGFILQGIIGLFVGAVVLTVGYKLFLLWLAGSAAPESVQGDNA